MKNKASLVVKNMIAVLSSIVKSKIMGVKSKADGVRVRLLVFSLLKSKKFSLGSISNKIQTLLDKKGDHEVDTASIVEDESKAIVLYNAGGGAGSSDSQLDYYTSQYPPLQLGYYNYEDDDKYPDFTHSLFDEQDDIDDQGGSVIDIVKNSKEQDGRDFKLEDEIDNVADLFKKHMRLEKLESFKRYQAMLGRTA
ncbi:hypothetical protein Cgig2_028773 [Carnegiea gigantea]|uniref:Uncharacterized protein n=1 Tax=Carnegiea gigantea TaxID=171969 RepID=A0A9Q1Q5S1_9CARY|nr:hypothetical protein Cgig2_028773 [Carnegiea gigantea]